MALNVGTVAGIAIGVFICGAVLSSLITLMIYNRWYVT